MPINVECHLSVHLKKGAWSVRQWGRSEHPDKSGFQERREAGGSCLGSGKISQGSFGSPESEDERAVMT